MPKIVGTAEDASALENDDWEVPTPRSRSMVTPSTPTPVSPKLTNSMGSAKKFVFPGAASFYVKAPEKAKAKGPL
jgi:hypothetical protein